MYNPRVSKERKNTTIAEVNDIGGPSEDELKLLDQRYFQDPEAGPAHEAPFDIHHDRDGLSQYMADLRPHLKPRYNTKLEDDEMFKAKDYEGLFYSVAKMVVSQAFRHTNARVSVMDLVQAGNLAVWEDAIRTYKPEKEAKFSTWAMWWIRQKMLREVNGNHSEYEISERDVLESARMQKKYYSFMAQNGHEPSTKELSEITGFEPEKVKHLREIERMRGFSLTQSDDDGNKSDRSDLIEDRSAAGGESVEREIAFNQTLEAFYKEIQSFSEQNKRKGELLMLRLGCDSEGKWTGKVWTLREIAKKYGVTLQRITQLQWHAVRLISNPELKEVLLAYLGPQN